MAKLGATLGGLALMGCALVGGVQAQIVVEVAEDLRPETVDSISLFVTALDQMYVDLGEQCPTWALEGTLQVDWATTNWWVCATESVWQSSLAIQATTAPAAEVMIVVVHNGEVMLYQQEIDSVEPMELIIPKLDAGYYEVIFNVKDTRTLEFDYEVVSFEVAGG